MLKCFFIHVGHHQNLVGLIILYNNWKKSVRIQREIRKTHRTFQRSHLNSFGNAMIFECIDIKCRFADQHTRNALDTLAF